MTSHSKRATSPATERDDGVNAGANGLSHASVHVTNLAEQFYVFFRKGVFYPLLLGSDDEACANAEANLGTTKVETITGRLVWRQESK